MSKTQDDVEQHPLLPEDDDDQPKIQLIRKVFQPYIFSIFAFFSGAVFAVVLFAAFAPQRTPGYDSSLGIYCELIFVQVPRKLTNINRSTSTASTGIQTYKPSR
jgi:hypothetical protein